MREVLCLVVGFGIVAAVTVDVVWTTLGTHGGGPVSAAPLGGFWRGLVGLHNRRPHHRLLSFGGSTILALLLVFWISLLWIGWVFVYSARQNALVQKDSHKPATVTARIYFTGTTLSTSGTSEVVPNGTRWRLIAAVQSITGIGTMTLAVTFLIQVLGAVVHKRTLGAYLSDLGGTPAKIIERAWDGKNFDSLNDHFLELTGMLHVYTEEHLAYPVLHYFHSERDRTAATLRVAALNELVVLIGEGAAPEVRMMPMIIEPVRGALAGFANMLTEEGVRPADDTPEPPSISILRDLGIPAVDDETFRRGVQNAQKTRRFFAGLLREDGWEWERIDR